jgi:hypothetical protein
MEAQVRGVDDYRRPAGAAKAVTKTQRDIASILASGSGRCAASRHRLDGRLLLAT